VKRVKGTPRSLRGEPLLLECQQTTPVPTSCQLPRN